MLVLVRNVKMFVNGDCYSSSYCITVMVTIHHKYKMKLIETFLPHINDKITDHPVFKPGSG